MEIKNEQDAIAAIDAVCDWLISLDEYLRKKGNFVRQDETKAEIIAHEFAEKILEAGNGDHHGGCPFCGD